MRNPLLDPLRGELAEALLRFAKPRADDLHEVERDLRMPVKELQELLLRPADLDGVDDRGRVRRIVPVGEESDSAEHFAWADESHDELTALLARLSDPHAPYQKHMTALGGGTLREQHRAPPQRPNPSAGGDLIERGA
jgi:hypothetical protein